MSAGLAGLRLDQALARLFPAYSRSRLQRWIEAGQVRVDGAPATQRLRVLGGERVELIILETAHPQAAQAEAIPLAIVYEDEALIVVNKPAGLVVHPAAGHAGGTLVNALIAHAPELAALPRAGLVHRLDKDTSGLLIVARTLGAHTRLVRALAARDIEREYDAIACGVFTAGGTVDAPLGRHARDRLRQAVTQGGRNAVTHYRVQERFRAHAWLRVRLETGRTHQIRVHLAHIHHPLIGDPLYGRRALLPPRATEDLRAALQGFHRQALHAARLALEHPLTGRACEWRAPVPDDLAALITALRADACARFE